MFEVHTHRGRPYIRASPPYSPFPFSLSPSLPSFSLLLIENKRQPILSASDHDDLRVRALRQVLGRLDSFPAQKVLVDPLADGRLEVGDALRLDSLPLRLLLFALEREGHPLRLLLRLQLLLDRVGQLRRQVDLA